MQSLAFLIACSFFLVACDGGIFGTGNPDPLIIDAGSADIDGAPLDADSGFTEANDAAIAEGDAGASDDGTTDSGGGNAAEPVMEEASGSAAPPMTLPSVQNPSQSVDSTLGFTNDTTSQGSELADLYAVNTTTQAVLLVLNNTNDRRLLLSDAAGLTSGSFSLLTSVTPGTGTLVVESVDDTTAVASVDPLIVSAGSYTGLLIREFNNSTSVVPLIVASGTTDPTLAKVRIAQAAAFDNIDASAELTLLSAGSNPGGIDTAFSAISYVNSNSDYIEVPAGDYELTDPLQRISPQALTFEGGTVVTLVLTDNSQVPVLVVVESQ